MSVLVGWRLLEAVWENRHTYLVPLHVLRLPCTVRIWISQLSRSSNCFCIATYIRTYSIRCMYSLHGVLYLVSVSLAIRPLHTADVHTYYP